jgi:hypothetical protein
MIVMTIPPGPLPKVMPKAPSEAGAVEGDALCPPDGSADALAIAEGLRADDCPVGLPVHAAAKTTAAMMANRGAMGPITSPRPKRAHPPNRLKEAIHEVGPTRTNQQM